MSDINSYVKLLTVIDNSLVLGESLWAADAEILTDKMMYVQRYAWLLLMASWLIFCLYYYDTIYGPIKSSLGKILPVYTNKDISMSELLIYKGIDDFLINTPGCVIPNYGKSLKLLEATIIKQSCGIRAVYIEKISHEYLQMNIDSAKMTQYSKGNNNYACCYQFVTPAIINGTVDHRKISYSPCTAFKDRTKIKLEEEIVMVKCTVTKTKLIYEDAYTFVKKRKEKREKSNNNTKSWNVLILGMDTMSRARFIHSMPKTSKFFRKNGWLDFRAYQKVGYNTFPNVMAVLTGMNLSQVQKECRNGMDNCNHLMLWSHFKDSGYYTASGEEFLRLPDTFTRYNGYKNAPTDHYMRPFFLTGENEKGNTICAKKRSSAKHLLDYALDFTDTYKNDRFFGMFWFNSFSHNLNNVPQLIDADVEIFFNRFHKTDILKNTFVFFLSDHGLRFGAMREPYESYYEERLPMLYLWVPLDFRKHLDLLKNLLVNQNRLVTPYDMYATLVSILELSRNNNNVAQNNTSSACPDCISIFNEFSPQRTCSDAKVLEKWCTCHPLSKANSQDVATNAAIDTAITDIHSIIQKIETRKCMRCADLKLKTILRVHKYITAANTTVFVVAFKMIPGDVSYEASIEQNGASFTVLGNTQTISVYNIRGKCVINPVHRAYCICEKKC